MDEVEQIKKLLKRNLEVSEESFKILKKMHKAQVWGRIMRISKWVLILSLAFGTYYYIQPYMENFWGTVNEIVHSISSLREASQSVKDLPPDVFGEIKGVLEGL